MSIDSDIFDVMAGYAPLTALVGSGAAVRIYPSVIAQGVTMPAVAYALRTDAFATLLGEVGINQTRIVVQCWAEGIAQAKAVADEVVAAFAAQAVPLQSRDGLFDAEIGLHAETIEFDWWST
jgi:hypothetical protein